MFSLWSFSKHESLATTNTVPREISNQDLDLLQGVFIFVALWWQLMIIYLSISSPGKY